jgi:molecular chaperone DnaK (HSP70)
MDILSKPMTPEEQEKVVALRTEFSDAMNSLQTQSFQDEKRGALSPESVRQIFKVIETNQEWLVKNKSAKYVEIFSKYQDYKSAIKTIKDSDVPRRKLNQVLKAFPLLTDIFLQRKNFDEESKKKLMGAHETLKKWYEKNGDNADTLTLQQQYQTLFVLFLCWSNNIYHAMQQQLSQN